MRQQLPAGKQPSALLVQSLGKGRGFLQAGGVRSQPGDKVSHLLCGAVCTAAGGRARSKNPTFFPVPNIRDRHPFALRALSFPSASLGSLTRASERWGWPSIILLAFLAWPMAPRRSLLQAAQERRRKAARGNAALECTRSCCRPAWRGSPAAGLSEQEALCDPRALTASLRRASAVTRRVVLFLTSPPAAQPNPSLRADFMAVPPGR